MRQFFGAIADFFAHHHPAFEKIKHIVGFVSIPSRIRAIIAVVGSISARGIPDGFRGNTRSDGGAVPTFMLPIAWPRQPCG